MSVEILDELEIELSNNPLEKWINKFNVFDVLKITRMEIRHMQDNLFVNYIFRQDTKKIPLDSVIENTILFTFREFEPIAIVLE